MSAGYLPVLGAALRHGPWVAGLCAFAVTPGALVVIARVLERRGYYTRAQAVAPTKIWHQVVVYPVLGYWLWTAGIGGLSAPGGAAGWAGKGLLLVLTGIWAGANVYDRRHPKLGHPPFDWRRMRPRPRPWAAESQTLLAAERRG